MPVFHTTIQLTFAIPWPHQYRFTVVTLVKTCSPFSVNSSTVYLVTVSTVKIFGLRHSLYFCLTKVKTIWMPKNFRNGKRRPKFFIWTAIKWRLCRTTLLLLEIMYSLIFIPLSNGGPEIPSIMLL